MKIASSLARIFIVHICSLQMIFAGVFYGQNLPDGARGDIYQIAYNLYRDIDAYSFSLNQREEDYTHCEETEASEEIDKSDEDESLSSEQKFEQAVESEEVEQEKFLDFIDNASWKSEEEEESVEEDDSDSCRPKKKRGVMSRIADEIMVANKYEKEYKGFPKHRKKITNAYERALKIKDQLESLLLSDSVSNDDKRELLVHYILKVAVHYRDIIF